MAQPTALLSLAAQVLARREELQGAARRGYAQAVRGLPSSRPAADPFISIPPGMLEALTAASLARPESAEALQLHYGTAMPGMLAAQLRRAGGVEERLFGARLDLARLPRLRAGLEALFALVAEADLSCARVLGAATPRALIAARPTLGELYTGCHFGSSMPMLYAYPGDLSAERDAMPSSRDPLAWIDARYVGPLIHELAHFHAEEVPAPGNLHESLAAWIGSEAWAAQIFPAAGEEDGLPGGAWFAAVGGFLARALGTAGALQVQAGVLDLRDALGAPCAEALRLFGFLPFLETGAPHLLSDAFRPDRWWKLIDLHRDPALTRELHALLVAPLLAAVPAPGASLQPAWNAALDALRWQDLPSFRDEPGAADHALYARAERALQVRAERHGNTFRAVRRAPPGPLVLDHERCALRAPWPGPDAVGAPPWHPVPPALCRQPAVGGEHGIESD